MKRIVFFTILGLTLIAIPVANQVWGKAHVPVKRAQVCHKGTVIVVSENAVQGHVRGHGDCQLPACDFNNVFMAGESCVVEDSGNGTCVLDFTRDEAVNDACPEGKF